MVLCVGFEPLITRSNFPKITRHTSPLPVQTDGARHLCAHLGHKNWLFRYLLLVFNKKCHVIAF